MIFGRFFKVIAGFLVCIVFIRAVNGAGPLSLMDILVDLQEFEFDFNGITDLIALFEDGVLADHLYSWDYNLTGLEGFFVNLGRVLSSFFDMCFVLCSTVVKALWSAILAVIGIFVQLMSLLSTVLGFRFSA